MARPEPPGPVGCASAIVLVLVAEGRGMATDYMLPATGPPDVGIGYHGAGCITTRAASVTCRGRPAPPSIGQRDAAKVRSSALPRFLLSPACGRPRQKLWLLAAGLRAPDGQLRYAPAAAAAAAVRQPAGSFWPLAALLLGRRLLLSLSRARRRRRCCDVGPPVSGIRPTPWMSDALSIRRRRRLRGPGVAARGARRQTRLAVYAQR
ncbi:hypothetical protein CDD83_9255 [Cordyceps sp. RAO-2017]|nr:hypothetical protein CDD83_9255 [Cordyceps sp. RAO-2017]